MWLGGVEGNTALPPKRCAPVDAGRHVHVHGIVVAWCPGQSNAHSRWRMSLMAFSWGCASQVVVPMPMLPHGLLYQFSSSAVNDRCRGKLHEC